MGIPKKKAAVAPVKTEAELRAAWLAERRRGIGASDASAALGISPWKSPLELYAEKRGLTDEVNLAEENELIYWGQKLEALIVERYVEQTGRELITTPRYSLKWYDHALDDAGRPFIFASADALVMDKQRGKGVVEAKALSSWSKKGWTEDEAPVHYMVQLQQQMLANEVSWGSFAFIVDGRKFGYFDVDRNDKFHPYLIRKLHEFWMRVLAKEPPPVSKRYHEGDDRALRVLYPQDTGDTVDLPEEYIDIADQLEAAKAQAKESSETVDALKVQVKAAIGDAKFGQLPDGRTFQLGTTSKVEYVVPAQVQRVLRLLKKKE